MIFAVLLLLTALAISVVAAYFSIIGLTLIFSAAPIPIAVMGSVLELGKLVTASFLYRWWHRLNMAMKSYLLASVILLSIITSLGIFGYLSKSYISDSASIFASETQLKTKQELLEVEKTRLTNLLLQQSQRADPNRRIERQIDDSQTRIYELTTEIGRIRGEKNALSMEIGPIRYIAELIYGDGQLDTIDKAVRIIIISIMFVFDPLAILLVVAANMQFRSLKNRPKTYKKGNTIEINKSEVLSMYSKDLR